MLVMSVQKEKRLDSIISGTYKPNLYKSRYGCMSIRFTKGYNKIKRVLSKKTGIVMDSSSSTYWGWAKCPYVKFHRNVNVTPEELVVLFMEIPESQCVLSDYDKYCDYVNEESNNMDFILEDLNGDDAQCVQVNFLSIKKENILLTIPYTSIAKYSEKGYTISELYEKAINERKVGA